MPYVPGCDILGTSEEIIFAATRENAANAGFDDSYIYQQIPLAPEKRDLPTAMFLNAEALAVFKTWIDADQKSPINNFFSLND